ncbi:hypothetical protein PTSG_03631 [Salpingoeca rosetta]|uniref:MARVEL domain-containing protein n=1 Tax=Salpingoeca rosetta (strain ATCC 50818 / BSB-021) TaxID=946362 RepID=F2U654_SALR5|nr:uncharacterized protein PTSG_03631 [Salpingoeca rosetta]EGD82995.1 hypothetical protein PTSG_03631 [Salpingoeca rosetta]|eukprot:XP_004995359.1 hypothetical protein PTSG_03631 [Salpingoeca rosetta]
MSSSGGGGVRAMEDMEGEADHSQGFSGCWQGVDISGAGFFAAVLVFLMLILFPVAMGTDQWASSDAVNMGLFQYCDTRCQQYVDNRFPPTGQNDLNLVTTTEACAAFIGLAITASFFAMVQIVFGLGRTGYDRTVFRAAVCAYFAAGCGILATIIFGALVNELPSSYAVGYSFNVNVAAWIISAIAGMLLNIDSRNISYVDPAIAVHTGGRQMI